MASVSFLSLENGFNIVNELDLSRLPKLLSKIAQHIGSGTSNDPFSAAEKEKLCEALEVNSNKVDTLLATIIAVFQKAAYHSWKVATLEKELSCFLDKDHSQPICQAWLKYGKEVIAELKTTTLTACQLGKIDWHLGINTAHQTLSKTTEPVVVFQLKLDDYGGECSDNVLMELNHNDLLQFYSKLEAIQQQLDALS